MSIAKGLFKTIAVKKQTALGTAASGSGGQLLRRKQIVFNTTRNITSNDEIVSHMQDTGVTYGQKSVTAKLDGALSPLTYSLLMAGLLRKAFTATTAITGLSITISGSGPHVIARASGDWLAGGIKAGDVVRLTAGSFTAINKDNNFIVTGVTALNLTGWMLNGDTMVAEGPIASATLSVIGKKSYCPTTGHTNDYFTFEEWYSDITQSEVYPDCKVSQIQVSMPASGAASLSVDIIGVGVRNTGSSQVLTTPGAETTTGVLEAARGILFINGTEYTGATGAQINIDAGVTPTGAVIGSVSSNDLNQSRLKVSGNFTGQFTSGAVRDLFDAETAVSMVLVAAHDGSKTSDFMVFSMGKVRITGDAPDDGEKEIVRTYNFVAELNGDGGAALAWDNTIITIQDSAA